MEGFYFFNRNDSPRDREADSARLERRLPTWARRRHPILARERRALPRLRIDRPRWWPEPRDAPLRALLLQLALSMGPVFVGLVILVVVPFQVSAALLLLTLTLLNWIPLLWTAPVISREVAAGRWDVLRATPYGTRVIVLAKLSAVARHLALVLQLALLVQLLPVSIPLLALVFEPVYGDVFGLPLLLLIVFGTPLLALVSTVLDYGLNIASGGLASTVTGSRGLAILSALGLRAGLSLLYLLGVAALVNLPGRGVLLATPVDLAVLAGPPAWTVALVLEHDPLAAL
ncbi:MAG: hypothetical protein JW910_14345, partial [Anaerolineae bacterium]|nr:hypothetical protein [Anaerolineae bacterium]